MNGYKFDVRTYVLVAAQKPFLAFQYEEGLVRRAKVKFSTQEKDETAHIMNSRQQLGGPNGSSWEDHFHNFSDVRRCLHEENGLPVNHWDEVVFPRITKITKFYIEAEVDELRRKNHEIAEGKFQLFALDWGIDQQGNVFLYEGNRTPLMANYPKWLGLSPWIWQEAMQLVKLIHADHKSLDLSKLVVKRNYTYMRWRMVYNALEEMWEAKYGRRGAYNPCVEFGLAERLDLDTIVAKATKPIPNTPSQVHGWLDSQNLTQLIPLLQEEDYKNAHDLARLSQTSLGMMRHLFYKYRRGQTLDRLKQALDALFAT